jgi:hypothetical protein
MSSNLIQITTDVFASTLHAKSSSAVKKARALAIDVYLVAIGIRYGPPILLADSPISTETQIWMFVRHILSTESRTGAFASSRSSAEGRPHLSYVGATADEMSGFAHLCRSRSRLRSWNCAVFLRQRQLGTADPDGL